MPDPRNQPPNANKTQYEALQSFDLTGSGRHVKAGEQFEATPAELAGVVEGSDYRRAPTSPKP
jgi:hypothetical protein